MKTDLIRTENIGVRKRIGNFITNERVQNIILGIIIFNAITMGLETFPSVQDRFGGVINFLDEVILIIFTIEILLKFIAFDVRFFKSGWNIFDLIVVAICYLPMGDVFTVLRSLRVLRVFRLVSGIPRLRIIVEAMLKSLPSMGWIVMFAAILLYVFGIIGHQLFGVNNPELFGSLGASVYTMFEVMTVEGWNGTAREVGKNFPYFQLFFIPFLIIGSYTMMNMVVGIIVNSVDSVEAEQRNADVEEAREEEREANQLMLAEIRELKEQIRELHDKYIIK